MNDISPYFDDGIDGGVDPEVEDVPSPTDSVGATGQRKKTRQVFRRLKKEDEDGVTYPFLEQPDDKELSMYNKELSMYSCLVVSKPFATTKWNGVTAAWTAAVKEINEQVNFTTGALHFNPPISVKTVRERFEGAMKIIKELDANVPFRSGNNDEEEPSKLLMLLEDLYEQKISFDTDKAGQKDSATAKKKKSRDDAKAIQEASLGIFISRKAVTEADELSDDDNNNKKRAKSDVPVKKSRGSLSNTLGNLAEAIEENRVEKKFDRELKRRLAEEQQQAKKEQEAEKHQQQLQMNLKMMAMMDAMFQKITDK
jgi:hypothetical protein